MSARAKSAPPQQALFEAHAPVDAGTSEFRPFMLLNGPSSDIVDPKDAAESAGLIYVSDEEPGIRRKKAGKGFTYIEPGGGKVEDEATLKRIHKLAIPPAYTNVWICTKANGHLQATGRD